MSAAAAMRLTQLPGEPESTLAGPAHARDGTEVPVFLWPGCMGCMKIRVCLVSRCPHLAPAFRSFGSTASAAGQAGIRVPRQAHVVRLAAMSPEDLPIAEFAFPGPLRDLLVTAILTGAKTTTTGLVAGYAHEGEPLPRPGLRQTVIDSAGQRVAVIETTAVQVIRLGDIGLAHALGEGEGYHSVAEWRAGHEQFWHSAEMRGALGDPEFTVNDDTLVVAQTFRLLER
jgi:uncharacterized protein YhfF